MGNKTSAPAAGGAAKPGLAPRAVKFGAPAELGPILGACFSRVGSSAEKPPVVVAASADTVDLFNGLTGACCEARPRAVVATLLGVAAAALHCRRQRGGPASACTPSALTHFPTALLASSTPATPLPCAADRKQRLKRRVPLTCVDFKADTTFGFVMLAGTAGGEVVLYDVATLK